MTMDFDPRAWNLLAGLALVTGCSGRTISLDGDATDSSHDAETTVNPDSGSESGSESVPECVDENDCPSGYYCYNGVCEYAPHPDGHVPYYDCYSDSECGQQSICEFNYCQYIYSPPPCEFLLPEAPLLEIPELVLALAFVDVDQDGAQELIAATPTQLLVYESGSLTPVAAHARGNESQSVDAMVGGDFDANPGLDVLLLHDNSLDMHAGDGLGNLAPAVPIPSPYPLLGLVSGEFDGQPLTDLLVWGPEASGIYAGDGSVTDVAVGAVSSCSARSLGEYGEGFTLLRDSELLFIDLGGFGTGSGILRGAGPRSQTNFDAFGSALEVGTSVLEGWTLIEAFERANTNLVERWSLIGSVTQSRTGDLDGLDDADELALIHDDGVTLRVGGTCLLAVPIANPVIAVTFGDHDGDGDDELAMLTQPSTVSITDVE